MSPFSITQLWVYPVKSLGGVQVGTVDITAAGSFQLDREWIITTPKGKMLWQVDLPRMTLLSAHIESGDLHIVDPTGASIHMSVPTGAARLPVRQYGFELPGHDAGEAAASWLSERLERECRLVHVGPAAHQWGGLNPVHVVSLNSLAALNALLVQGGAEAVELERFRPNVVLGGTHDAFAEELAEEIRFADATLALREPCVRCELPNISRVDASRGRQPLKLLGTLSRQRGSAKPASFGTYCMVVGRHLYIGAVAD